MRLSAVQAAEPENIALNKSAWSSSNDTSGLASNAVDGKTSGAYMTVNGGWPFCAVDFGVKITLKSVILWEAEGEWYIFWCIISLENATKVTRWNEQKNKTTHVNDMYIYIYMYIWQMRYNILHTKTHYPSNILRSV